MKKIFFFFGTRPEAIKLAPIILLLQNSKDYKVTICVSSQHVELLHQVLEFFKIKIHYNLNIMTHKQSLFDITSKCISQLNDILKKETPDLIIVQGDTSSAFSGALAGFYSKIPVAHVEAGLRTHNPLNPYPEEMNRKLISQLATFHFAPTKCNKENLEKEGIKSNIWVVGNTVIDSLNFTNKHVCNGYNPKLNLKNSSKKLILVTGHRRENVGKPFENLCKELIKIAQTNKFRVIFPLHLNPELTKIAHSLLNSVENIQLIDPQPYPDFIWLIKHAKLIITDSGGVQEEAPFFGIPTLVTRKSTERTESLTVNSKLIDLTKDSLHKTVINLFENSEKLSKLAKKSTPYGEGNSAQLIQSILRTHLT